MVPVTETTLIHSQEINTVATDVIELQDICSDISAIALLIIATTGLVLSAILFSTCEGELLFLATIIFGVSVLCLLFWSIFSIEQNNEIDFRFPDFDWGRIGGFPINDLEFITELPEHMAAIENPLHNVPVRAGMVRYGNRGITMPDPGQRLEGTGIDPRHLIETLAFKRSIPNPPENISPGHIGGFLRKMNFTNPDDPCYLFAGTRDIAAGIERFRRGGRATFERELRRYLQRLPDDLSKNYLKLIIMKWMEIEDNLIDPANDLYIPNNDPRLLENHHDYNRELKETRDQQIQTVETRNQGLMQLVESLEGCDNRVRMETYEVFRRAFGLPATNLETDIKGRLEDLRYNLLTSIQIDHDNPHTHHNPHNFEGLLYEIGPIRGISEDIYLEFYPRNPEIQHPYRNPQNLQQFNRLYNKNSVIDVVKGWIDGVEGTNAQNIPVRHRELILEQVTEWFNGHIPPSYTTPLNDTDYQSIQEQYRHEEVFEPLEAHNNQAVIKRDAIEYLLVSIGVVTQMPMREEVDRPAYPNNQNALPLIEQQT